MAVNLITETLGAIRSAIAAFADRRRSRATKREFLALGRDECASILDIMGVTLDEFEEAMLLPYASEDMLSLAMLSIGIDPDSFKSQTMAKNRFMSRTCVTCAHRRRCHSHMAAFDFESHYLDFCPNRNNFAELLAKGQSC
ncbi:hypothetical protein [Mesorhizobium sp.]|uniref:hypothetical protein n=1 Tax=Mesorhizobium sp. TaxID=1871066 RepID=UPI000FE8246B|nr:hypothetical protein [Mesorhizobium sp.]RWA68026.1 MAG: hypothetical protein EOQ29_21545 [Mesorhizobium sp.]RWB19916.1 MAG: hypothetical protein EOQ40_17430 [Mesorhizobium sp.]TIU01402.1 MAG: hypothetical protein E5W55_00440 [Mesorhizobium sp.]